MSSKVVLVLTHNRSGADMGGLLNANGAHAFMANLLNILNGIDCGAESGKVELNYNTVAASGTLTLASVIATDVCTVNGQAFTCVASGATVNQFNVGATDTATAANLAAAINASNNTAVTGYVLATSSGAIVTITAQVPGLEGNAITLATSDATITVSGATLAGGTEGTRKTFSYGIA